MADVKDPVEYLAEFLDDYNLPSGAKVAITELERRARVERRLEAWLKEETTGLPRAAHHQLDVAGNHVVSLQIAAEDAAFDRRADYWTAADAALDKAGAPKESD